MTAELARLAAESVLGAGVGLMTRLAVGRSCEAYVIELADRSNRQYVIRVPVAGTDRSIRFKAEAALGAMLAGLGHPVAEWRVVDIDGIACAVGPRLMGTPIRYGLPWTATMGQQLGDLLADLHALPAEGFGPLMDISTAFRGESSSVVEGVRSRWDRAVCWPFDGSDLGDHVVSRLMPDVASAVTLFENELVEEAERTPVGVVHSDLHQQHLLVGPQGELAGLLDFGDAFVGSIGWDFALLRWYYGADISRQVARRHPSGRVADQSGRVLALAVGIYKLAKTPTDPDIPDRLRRSLRGLAVS